MNPIQPIALSPALQQALEEIENATRGMTDEEMSWHREGKWSSAGLVEHLALAYSRSAAGMRKALSEGKPELRKPTPKERVARVILFRFRYIPPGRKAAPAIHPTGLGLNDALDAARRGLALADQTMNACEEKLGAGVPVYIHPVLGPLTASQWREFHLVHTVHHMRQVRKMREKMAAQPLKAL